ncbi:hypothetical protein F0237_12005 [Vibrio tubiashii]|uniref:Uncharacterized protein n=1 Tax=Vibrio tubiashii TaxID=29498 RepID=A0AAE5GQZ7_9VIBR|nr:hypothetical protein [Vibrio tubiashii]
MDAGFRNGLRPTESWRAGELGAGSWELGAGSWELGAGSWELGAGEMFEGWRLVSTLCFYYSYLQDRGTSSLEILSLAGRSPIPFSKSAAFPKGVAHSFSTPDYQYQ